MKKYIHVLAIIVLIFISVLAIIIIYPTNISDKSTQSYGIIWNEDNDDTKEEIHYIRIKGFDTLTMSANQEKQVVAFNNPNSNAYYMIMEIEVYDTIRSSKDIIWTSDKLYPGYGLNEIVLNRVMYKGKYESKYIVRCFDINTDVEVNGCVFDFILNVE